MAYDEGLAFRVEEMLMGRSELDEKRMFGGIAWLVNGNVAVGVFEESLICRIGPEEYKAALTKPGIREFDITGRPTKGWIMASDEAINEDNGLKYWIDKGLEFGSSLPAK